MYEKIGSKLRALRKRAKLTLSDLSNLTGLSSSYLSKLESGKAGISVTHLHKITSALHIEISTLMMEEEEATVWVTRAGHRTHLVYNNGVTYEQLIPALTNFGLSGSIVKSQPGETSGDATSQRGDEFRYVLKGTFRYIIGEEEHTLNVGDSISYSAILPHRWENVGQEEGVLLVVSTMPDFS